MTSGTSLSWPQVLQIIGIIIPAAFFLIAVCACCYRGFAKSDHLNHKRKVQQGLQAVILVACCVEGGLHIIHENALSRNDPDLAIALFEFLLWLVLFLSLFEIPAGHPHIGAWCITLVCKVVGLGVKCSSKRVATNEVSTTLLSLEVARLVVVILQVAGTLLPPYISSTDFDADLFNQDDERQPLLSNDTKDAGYVEEEEDLILTKLRQRPALQYLAAFKVFLPYIVPHTRNQWFHFGVLGACKIVTRLVNVLTPLTLGWLVDAITRENDKIWTILTLYICLHLLRSQFGVYVIERYADNKLTTALETSIKTAAYNHILDLDCTFHDNAKRSNTHQTMHRGEGLISLLDSLIFELAPSGLDLVIATVVLCSLFGPYFGFLIVFVGVGFWYIRYKSLGKMNDYHRQRDDQWFSNYYHMTQSTTYWTTVSQFEKHAYEKAKFSGNAESLQDLTLSFDNFHLLIGSAGDLLIQLGYCLACILVIYQISEGVLEGAAKFVVLQSYWRQVSTPIEGLARTAAGLSGQLVEAEKLLALFETQPRVEESPDATDFEFRAGQIEFKLVKFSYDGKLNAANDLSFSVPAGQTVALVGETGCGKSTIFKLLFRFYELDDGLITIDGQSIQDVKLESFRKHIGWVPQNPPMFNMSILDNARYPDNNIPEEEVIEACKAVALHDKIIKFPKQYHTTAGEGGCKLSGGEVQRLAIARVMLKKPKILLLDEATSQIDAITEAKVQKALRKLSSGITTMIIAHRLSTICRADKILVIKEGKVVQEGKHEEIVGRPGPYHELWTNQFSPRFLDEDDEEESKPGSAMTSGGTAARESEAE